MRCGTVRAVPTDDDWLPEAVTITFVRGLGLRAVGDLLALEWDTEPALTFDEAEELQDVPLEVHVVQLAEVDGWVVVVEPKGWFSSMTDIVQAMSRGGEAVSVFRNVNAHMSVIAARGGTTVRAFDPLLFDDQEGDPLPEEQGLPFGSEDADPHALALELAERLTGVAITEDWLLETPRSTWTTQGPDPVDLPAGPSLGATLRIARSAGGRLRREVHVDVDGEQVATLREDGNVALWLTPGAHTLRARAGSALSEVREVQVAEGDVVRVLVEVIGAGLLSRGGVTLQLR